MCNSRATFYVRRQVEACYVSVLSCASMSHRPQIEMSRLRESLEAEKEAWLAANKQQQAQALAQATVEAKEQLRKERDRELEAVIERLESEATQARLEKEQATENRIRSVKHPPNFLDPGKITPFKS